MTTHEYYQRNKENTMATNGNGIAKFTPGAVAEVIALARPGEEVPSQYRPFKQMLYELADGRTWYAPLSVGVKLENLDLAAGECFRVCKRPFGNSGSAVIDVMRCNPAEPVPCPAPQPSPVKRTVQADDSTGSGSVLEAKLKASIAATKAPTPAAPVPGTSSSAYLMTGTGQAVLQHYTDAIDIVIAARKYAALCGLDLGPTSFEDVRCMAATSRINAQGGR